MSRSAANSVARRRWRVYVSSGRAGAGFHSCARVCGHRWPASTCSYRCSCGVMGLRRKREPRFFSRPSPSRGPWVSTLGGRVRDEAYGITNDARSEETSARPRMRVAMHSPVAFCYVRSFVVGRPEAKFPRAVLHFRRLAWWAIVIFCVPRAVGVN